MAKFRFVICPKCNGYGVLDSGKNCTECGGKGQGGLRGEGTIGSGEVILCADTGARVTLKEFLKACKQR